MTSAHLPRLRVPLAVLAALAIALLGARPASAHSAAGSMTLLRAEESAPLHAQIEVGLLYANDGDVAEEATVTVELTGPDGATVGPVPAPRTTGGKYLAEVDLPAAGTWSFTVTAANPAASVTGSVEATPAPTTTEAPTTTAAPPPTSAAVDAPSTTSAPADEGSSDGSSVVLIGLLVAAVLAIAAIAAIVLTRRSPAAPPTAESGATEGSERQPTPDRG